MDGNLNFKFIADIEADLEMHAQCAHLNAIMLAGDCVGPFTSTHNALHFNDVRNYAN